MTGEDDGSAHHFFRKTIDAEMLNALTTFAHFWSLNLAALAIHTLEKSFACRHVAGGEPTSRWNARLNAASDS